MRFYITQSMTLLETERKPVFLFVCVCMYICQMFAWMCQDVYVCMCLCACLYVFRACVCHSECKNVGKESKKEKNTPTFSKL